MRLPPAVHVTLAASRRAAALIVALAACTFVAVCMLPVEPAVLALSFVVLAVWAGDRLVVVALRRGPRAVTALWLTADRLLVVRMGHGGLVAGHVRSSSYVGARITTIVWRPDGALRSRALLILPDMLPRDDFRRLRVLLRYGRSDDTQGVPASQP